MTQIRIALAEDHLLFRQGLIALLEGVEDIQIVFAVADGAELLDTLHFIKTDIVLLDVEMPRLTGREALKKMQILFPEVKVIILSQYYTDTIISDFILGGAATYLAKNAGIEKILNAIRTISKGEIFVDEDVQKALQRSVHHVAGAHPLSITEREIDVLKQIRKGKSAKEIAEILNISKKTVENHKTALFKKTGTSNSLELLNYATVHNIE